ncbi:MAG: flagellar hook-length control protein FliK [Lachnospiraceae bacterium]
MKVNESVNSANILMSGINNTSESNSDFANILSVASEKNRDLDVSDIGKTDNSNSVNGYGKTKQNDEAGSDVKTDDSVHKSFDKTSSVSKSKEKKDVDNADMNESKAVEGEAEVDKPVDDMDYEEIGEAIMTLLNNISSLLNISVEQLTDKMKELDCSFSDLLDFNQMKQLFLEIKEIDSTALLTDEDLNASLQQMIGFIDEALETMGDYNINPDDLSNAEFVNILMEQMDETKGFDSGFVSDVLNDDNGMDLVQNDDVSGEPVIIIENNKKDFQNGLPESDNQETDNPDYANEEKLNQNPSVDTKEKSFENPFLQGLQESLDAVSDFVSVEDSSAVNGERILNQIVEQVKVQLNQDSTSMQMQLYPEHLGKIQINVVSKDGIMTAHIVAESEAAKQAIEGGLSSLKEAIEQQNIKVEAIEVMVSSKGFEGGNENGSFSQENPKSKQSRKIDMSLLNEEDLDEEDIAEVEKMKATGSSVSYSI